MVVENEANCSLGMLRTGAPRKGAGGGMMICVLVGCETRAVGKSTKTDNDKKIDSLLYKWIVGLLRLVVD